LPLGGLVRTIKDAHGVELDSEFNLENISDISGLVLESWGPKTRNPKYNDAFDILLQRLMDLQVSHINVYVVSANLIKLFPNIKDRAISIDGSSNINLKGCAAKELRLLIGRAQASLKADPNSTGGNRTKRILIHNKNIDATLWKKIAEGGTTSEIYLDEISQPTSDRKLLDDKVEELLNTSLEEPLGIISPKVVDHQSRSYERDPKVKAWALRFANGTCEMCLNDAPFKKENGDPYLEVHHVLPLSEGGSDTIENTVAVCPNCHMKFHYGAEKMDLRNTVVNKINRLARETGN
jgi:5-methylcytosine-specific restriction protein A